MDDPPPPPAVSTTKTLTSLTSIPSNRTCADCLSTLVDASQLYASFSPKLEIPTSRYNHFKFNHELFRPPSEQQQRMNMIPEVQSAQDSTTTSSTTPATPLPIPNIASPTIPDPPVDPSLTASLRFGVFVCAPCAAAHKLLGPAIAMVRAVQDPVGWTVAQVERLAAAGGNQQAKVVFEAFLPKSWERKMRPTAESSIADRLTFCRAKYEALAFVLPPTGPLAPRAWRRIVQMHPEWKGLWGADLLSVSDLDVRSSSRILRMSSSSDDELPATLQCRGELPNRLVDYFCVVSASDFLHPQMLSKDLKTDASAPEDLWLAPQVTDCYPSEDTYEDTAFPQHVSTFVFPEGCHAKNSPMPPMLFTFVLTTGSGDRLYGACLRLYDDGKDIEVLRNIVEQSGYVGDLPTWLDGTAEPQQQADVAFFPKCLVVISHYPFFDLWRKFLLQIYRIALVQAPLPVERFIANFVQEVPLPPPGNVRVKFGFVVDDTWIIERPPENQLPLANFSYRPLFTALSVSNVMVVFGCLLQETRVALVSRHYSLLCPVAEALLSLLFPLHWQGMYLPVMPYSMTEMLDAPVPYLVGLHSRYLSEVPPQSRPQGVVFVDLDKDEVHLGHVDDTPGKNRMTPCLPDKKALKLKAKLDEFAAVAYLIPPTGKAGTLTTGNGEPLPYEHRESYAHLHPSEVPSQNHLSTRRDVFGTIDRAYRDNELLVPITGFLSEHGQFSKRNSVVLPSPRNPKGLFKKRKSGPEQLKIDPPQDESLFGLEEPGRFSSAEIRAAFLRFFVSLLKTYKQFLNDSGFDSVAFVASLGFPPRCTEYVESILRTQMFQGFILERQENPEDPEVRFFDENITAKNNRSKKVALVGGRKATTFLNDITSEIKDTFSPPPPSNWGLPDDGRAYQHASFPILNHALFGKIRPPREWPRSYQKSSYRFMRRQSTRVTQAREKAIVAKAMAPVVKTHAMLTAATKRGFRSLESALGALSAPFAVPSPSRGRDDDAISECISEVTICSTLDIGQDLLHSAEEVVLNARRKQVILMDIIVKLQAFARMYLARKRLRARKAESRLLASMSKSMNGNGLFLDTKTVVRLQALLRGFIEQKKYQKLRAAVVQLQAHCKSRRVRALYDVLLYSISKSQALMRGFTCRSRMTKLIRMRMAVYRKCTFELWKAAHTPLSYRTAFWPFLRDYSLVRLALADSEVLRLWRELNIDKALSSGPINLSRSTDEALVIGRKLGLDSSSYASIKMSLETPSAIQRTPHMAQAADREAAERLQIYERLSSMRSNRRDQFVKEFAGTDKLRKVSLATSIWSSFDNADRSTDLMKAAFPELHSSSDMVFREPSKKASRRISVENPIPDPLEKAMWAHTRLSFRIRRNVTEIADLSLRVVPALGVHGRASNPIPKVSSRYDTPGERRLLLMRHFFLSSESKIPMENTPTKEYPGDGFWKEEKAATDEFHWRRLRANGKQQ